MTISHISTQQNPHGNANFNWNFSVPSVAAQTGDVILIQTIARGSAAVMSNAAWNGQSSTNIGGASNSQTCMSIRYIVAASSGTYDVTGDMSDGAFVTATATVLRPSGTVTITGLTTQFHDDTTGPYVAPSRNIASVPSDSIVVDYLAMLGWAGNYADTTGTTMTAGGGFTTQGNQQNTGYPAVTRSYVATNAASGSVAGSWTASAGSPMYVHAMFYVQNTGGGFTIDSLDTPVRVGGTHNITTTGLGTLTTASTVGGKAIASASAPSGDGAITLASFTAGQTYPAMGTQTVIASDGTDTASISRTLDTMSGWQYVVVSGLDTGDWSLGKAFGVGEVPLELHVIDDGTGVLNADGTLTDWPDSGMFTCWARMASGGGFSAGEMTSFTFTVTAGGVTIGSIQSKISISIGISI